MKMNCHSKKKTQPKFSVVTANIIVASLNITHLSFKFLFSVIWCMFPAGEKSVFDFRPHVSLFVCLIMKMQNSCSYARAFSCLYPPLHAVQVLLLFFPTENSHTGYIQLVE